VKEQKKALPENQTDFNTFPDVVATDDYFFRISGWATVNDRRSSSMRLYVVLKNEQDTIILSSVPSERPDIVAHLKSDNYLLSGFNITYPLCKMKNGTYQIGYLMESSGESLFKLSDRNVTINNVGIGNNAECEQLYSASARDNLSLQDHFVKQVKASLRPNTHVGYVSDSMPPLQYEHRFREFQYSLAPFVATMNDLSRDTLVGFFPATKNIGDSKNPLFAQQEQWVVVRNFGNGIVLLTKNTKN
jgi:hypothetical protein